MLLLTILCILLTWWIGHCLQLISIHSFARHFVALVAKHRARKSAHTYFNRPISNSSIISQNFQNEPSCFEISPLSLSLSFLSFYPFQQKFGKKIEKTQLKEDRATRGTFSIAALIAFKNCDGRLVINAREQRKFHGIARFSNTKIRFPLLFFFFPSRISNRIEYFHVTAILVSWRDARAIKNYRRFPGNPADSREINASNREFLGKRYFCPNSFQQRFLGVSQGRAAKRRRKEEMEERRRRKCFFFFYFGDRLLMDFSIELIARPLLHDKFPR